MSAHTDAWRVAAARELLEGWEDADYDALPADCRANVQEAVEFLRRVETDVVDGGSKK